jgi:transposase
MFCLPFELPGFIVTHVESGEKTVIIGATAQQTTAICPRCQQPSQSVHSYYQRSPQDLPVSGKAVRLVLRVRRFRCQNPQCSQRTFAERHPEVLASYAQRTERLSSTLVHFAGGESSEPAAGTLLVDLTSHRPVDVLPDRTADTLSQWLRAHPGVHYVGRDRSPEYARG